MGVDAQLILLREPYHFIHTVTLILKRHWTFSTAQMNGFNRAHLQIQVNLILIKKSEFSHQKKVCIFRHLNRKCATKGLAVLPFAVLEFFSKLSSFNEKRI